MERNQERKRGTARQAAGAPRAVLGGGRGDHEALEVRTERVEGEAARERRAVHRDPHREGREMHERAAPAPGGPTHDERPHVRGQQRTHVAQRVRHSLVVHHELRRGQRHVALLPTVPPASGACRARGTAPGAGCGSEAGSSDPLGALKVAPELLSVRARGAQDADGGVEHVQLSARVSGAPARPRAPHGEVLAQRVAHAGLQVRARLHGGDAVSEHAQGLVLPERGKVRLGRVHVRRGEGERARQRGQLVQRELTVRAGAGAADARPRSRKERRGRRSERLDTGLSHHRRTSRSGPAAARSTFKATPAHGSRTLLGEMRAACALTGVEKSERREETSEWNSDCTPRAPRESKFSITAWHQVSASRHPIVVKA